MTALRIIGIMISAGLPALAENCTVNVRVETGEPMLTALHPEVKAMAMFHAIGLNVRIRMSKPWRDTDDGCGPPIVIQIDESSGYRGAPGALAYAAPYRQSGANIHIFLDRVTGRQRELSFANTLLAYVMVHEITHVLDQSVQHSPEGVMKATWARSDFQLMRYGRLGFTPENVERLLRAVAGRSTQLAKSDSPEPIADLSDAR